MRSRCDSLKRYGKAIGLPPNFTILDRGDAEDLLGTVRADLGLADAKRRFPSKSLCAEIYGRVVNSQQPLEDVLEEHFPAQRDQLLDFKALFKGYTAQRKPSTCSITTICCSSGTPCLLILRGEPPSASLSRMCSSMSIRTRTACRLRS